MPRPLKIDRPQQVHVHLPQSVYSLLRTRLYSEVEGRVPHGEFSRYITDLIRRDLAPEEPHG